MSKDLRVVFKKKPDSVHWSKIDFVDLRKGDVYVMYDACEPVLFKGEAIMIATSDAYLDEKTRMFTVECTSLKEYRQYELKKMEGKLW